MTIEPSDTKLWKVVSRLEHGSVEDWRKRYHPDSTHEGLWGRWLTSVETTVDRRQNGNISVTVSMLARRAFECEVDYYRLQRSANRVYTLVEPGSFFSSR